ncbi:MAG TPA: DUF1501 domain-containing protein [Acidimicrobiales bacterium]|nr:DUF1501 domain-containing protein [Acidimicrobiales bacterium]
MTYKPSRRRFLMQLSAATGAGVTAPLWLDLVQRGGLPFAWAMGEGDVLPAGTPVCVHIKLDGGNDYLNTLVPVEDGFYRDAAVGHGALALTPEDTLALTGTSYRLHNSLPWLADRWNTAGDVGFALGVGNLDANFSHFDSMKYWDTARLDVLGRTGWLGRYADAVRPQNALASVSLSDLRADAVGKTAPALVVQDCAGFSYTAPWLSSNVFMNGARQMATIEGTHQIAQVSKMMGTTFQVAERIKAADDPALTGDTSDYGGLTSIARQLVQTALLIKSGIPAQSYTMGFGPFDSHSDQRQMQTDRFTELNQGLSKFFSVLAGHARQKDVFVLITSEFGRQATANRDGGTDHGQAGMAVFIGGGVKRGVFGQAPTLDPGGATRPNRISDALRPTVDFRSVHATALNRLAKGNANVADEVLGARYEDLRVFPNRAPIAAMTLSAVSGPAPLTITADASASRDLDGAIAAYRWAWGDGTANTFAKTANHQYPTPGTFSVRLSVQDNRGTWSHSTKTVTVS